MATLQAALPRQHYVDEAQYEREREIVLAKSWTCAGRLTDVGLVDGARALLPSRLSVLALLGESVLVTTDADGRLHAHYNVCRHRGTQLVPHDPTTDEAPDPCGSRVLRCPYHSWTYAADGVTADEWTNELLAGLGTTLPLTVTQEQVTRFAPDDPRDFAADRFPVWIWMDDPCFYGFPADGEALVKAAQDCGGPPVTVWDRTFEPDPTRVDLLVSFVRATFPGLGRAVRSKTCLYTLTPDRDFVLDALPTHPDVLVGLGAGHGFKFAPTFGRILADLAMTGTTCSDISAFAIDRPALTEPAREPSWLV
jgi:nitrite reductase/ring-hydroxylating ferredoxin subunit